MLRKLALCGLGVSLASGAADLQVEVVSSASEPLPGVAVYAVAATPGGASRAPEQVEIQQLDKRFSPYLTVISVGDSVLFTNHDNITHHVYSVTGDTRFSFKIRPGEGKTLATFDHAGAIAMGCNVHDWMSGHLLVVATPYRELTGVDGVASFPDLVAGHYRVTAWHPQMQEPEGVAAEVDVGQGSRVRLELRHRMAEIPRQQPIDDFDFLEGY